MLVADAASFSSLCKAARVGDRLACRRPSACVPLCRACVVFLSVRCLAAARCMAASRIVRFNARAAPLPEAGRRRDGITYTLLGGDTADELAVTAGTTGGEDEDEEDDGRAVNEPYTANIGRY